jgi:hypothetical protein
MQSQYLRKFVPLSTAFNPSGSVVRKPGLRLCSYHDTEVFIYRWHKGVLEMTIGQTMARHAKIGLLNSLTGSNL